MELNILIINYTDLDTLIIKFKIYFKLFTKLLHLKIFDNRVITKQTNKN